MRLSAGYDDGRGIRLGVGAGGAVKHMDAIECAVPITPPRRLVRGVLVNAQGQRFINEDTYFGRVGQESLLRQNGAMFMIVDTDVYEVNRAGNEVSWVGETIAELEQEMALPAESLQKTIGSYNDHAARGEDPLFHKSPEFLKSLDEAPFGAIDFRIGAAIYATFTLGGLHTRTTGEVLTDSGAVVSGLYAAGRTTAGIAVGGYCSGISIGDGTFFGRLAGRSAAGT
jgi:3-oxo-5alpha-steroid 4-dehydrogenase